MADENEVARADDAELEAANGGTYTNFYDDSVIKNRDGKEIGRVCDGAIIYSPCPKCGRPTYSEWGAQHCDPCNDYWVFTWSISDKIWNGSRQGLIDAFYR